VFFSIFGLGLVFSICGGILWIIPYRYGGGFGATGRQLALHEEPWMAWARFIGGGIIGIAFVFRWWWRSKKIRPTSRGRQPRQRH
jgi:hypothetical protein